MSNKEEVVGVYAEDMTVADLKQLCKENNLDITGLKTKPEILKVVKKWEKSILKKTEQEVTERGATIKENKRGKKVATASEEVANVKEVEFHENKKVISKTDVTHNGRDYTDIVVEGGVTHRVPKKS